MPRIRQEIRVAAAHGQRSRAFCFPRREIDVDNISRRARQGRSLSSNWYLLGSSVLLVIRSLCGGTDADEWLSTSYPGEYPDRHFVHRFPERLRPTPLVLE